MAQFINWLKNLFKPKMEQTKLLTFNKKALAEELALLANDLYGNGGDRILKTIEKVIDTAKNIQILESNLIEPNLSCQINVASHKARIACFMELQGWLSRAVDPDDYHKRNKLQQPSGTQSTLRTKIKPSGQYAGPAS